MVEPTRKFLSLNKSISSNGTLPFLFLLISNNAKTAKAIMPKIITDCTCYGISVNIKIPRTNKIRPINEIMAPVMSKSLLDSVGSKSGILSHY